MNLKLNKILKKINWKNTRNQWDTLEVTMDLILIIVSVTIIGSIWYRFYG